MFESYRRTQFERYNYSRNLLVAEPQRLIELERLISSAISAYLRDKISELANDYDEASYLFPFWQNYPPDERGRAPIGDQYPWIEVGEHVFGDKLAIELTRNFRVGNTGLPIGPDERFVLSSDDIGSILGITDSCWLFLDIKSVGPRDDQDHTVVSHNQVSGDGTWGVLSEGVKNGTMLAKGTRTEHKFYPSISPLYVLSNALVLPAVTIVIKPVYAMPGLQNLGTGQPLHRVDIATIPNGLLLTQNPNYLRKHPDLFFPGKDDKSKNPLKRRARVSFAKLRQIDEWRHVKTEVIEAG